MQVADGLQLHERWHLWRHGTLVRCGGFVACDGQFWKYDAVRFFADCRGYPLLVVGEAFAQTTFYRADLCQGDDHCFGLIASLFVFASSYESKPTVNLEASRSNWSRLVVPLVPKTSSFIAFHDFVFIVV